MQIKNSVIIVTGASAGIGRATAVSLAQRGANVVVTARRADRLQALVTELESYPGQRLAIPGDIGQDSFVHELIAQTVAAYGRVDVLINNAGLGHHSRLAEIPAQDLQTVFGVNVMGLVYAIQAVVPQMRQQGYGQIINISSVVGQRPLPMSGAYCASKTAVNFLSRSLRMELRRHNITVTLVYPGLTATEFSDVKLGKSGSRFGMRGIPAKRVAEKIAGAIDKNETEVYVTWYDRVIVHASRLFPRTLDWFVGRALSSR